LTTPCRYITLKKVITREDPMLDHVSIGVRDLAVARRFYDAVFAPLGYRRLHEGDGYAGYGDTAPEFWLNATDHPVPADPRSGLHFSFVAPSRTAVDAFHAAGLAAGGRDNGPPGARPDYGPRYYAAFVVDPDGYRVEAHTEAM
jgi:catechol 2,3-dioxygenase-like lactoylglutathione lyase family enzyme